jgi:hypothetical protein
MRYNLFMVLVSIFLFCGSSLAQEAKKGGWWIKVNAQKPNAEIIFYVGSTDHSYQFWRVWNPGDPSEFDVPEEYQNGQTLYVLAQTSSSVKRQLCAMFKSKGLKHFEFNVEQGLEVKQSGEEDKKCR